MKNTSKKATQTRLAWLERAGYVLTGIGILLLLLGVVLPVDFSGRPHYYYRVVPAEDGWIMAVTPIALGILLVLLGRAVRTRGR